MSAGASRPIETSLQVRDTCLCLHAQRAARALARRFDKALKPFGLTNTQFSLLMALNGAEPAPMGRVAALLGADRTTLTAALKPLAGRGLVEVGQDPADRRSRRAALTAAGHATLAAALPAWRAAHEALEGELAEIDRDRLRAELRALSGAS